jgi:hypothetical protein
VPHIGAFVGVDQVGALRSEAKNKRWRNIVFRSELNQVSQPLVMVASLRPTFSLVACLKVGVGTFASEEWSDSST